ncbi:MAG: hypothetical protein K6A14_07655 [Erysipelotrichaceae bacterium]|nr:hypothetical protein [Erysipelotrichaceae bacterium]
MGIFDVLYDFGEYDYSSYYNGLLTDYLSCHQDKFNDLFTQIAEIDGEVRLYTNFEIKSNLDSLANKKIGYRDIAKVPSGVMKAPYIIYWKTGEEQRAILVNLDSYIEAKGMYYCLTEVGNIFEKQRLELLAMYLSEDNQNALLSCFRTLHENKKTVGAMQRKYDSQYIPNMEEMNEQAVEESGKLFDQLIANLAATDDKEEKARLIYRGVSRIFLLKKAVYVSYMTNKSLLVERHGENVVEQRRFAKAYADEIRIVPFYQLWNPDAAKAEDEEQ